MPRLHPLDQAAEPDGAATATRALIVTGGIDIGGI
jgi:hypothetical protein